MSKERSEKARSAKPRRPKETVTGTAELVLAPQIRRFPARLYLGAALAVGVLVVGAIAAVRYLSIVEPMLAAEGANAVRAVVYALPTGGEIHVPIEPRTDLLRFVVHAYGSPDMALTAHPVRLQLDVRGSRGKRTEELRLDAPGLRARVTPEDARLGVGDPLAFEVDVHDVGVGELVVKLADITGADGLLVRAYRREQLGDAELALRETALDRTKKNELAQWTWELGWDELGPAERHALLRARWRRVGAMRGAGTDLRSTTIAIAPPVLKETPPSREELLGRVALRGDERIALLVRAGVKVRFLCDEATLLTATARNLQNAIETRSAPGQIEVGPFDGPRSIELGAARDVLLEVRSGDANATEWLGWSPVWRITAARPVLLDSADADRVVRVSVRRPMPRADRGIARLGVVVDLGTSVARWSADRPRSRVERYEDLDPAEAPSERAWFFLSLPRGSHAKITPADGAPLDLSLAELDPSAPPLPLPARLPDTPPPVLVAETDDARSAFVPRRPSNLAAFDESARKVVRTAHWYAPATPPPPPGTVALAHTKHSDTDRVTRNGNLYDGIAKPFDLEADPRRPLYVPIEAVFDAPTTVTVRVEREPGPGGARAGPALFSRWTLPRTMDVGPVAMRATFVVGDDVPAGGKLRLRIGPATSGTGHQLVLLPWQSTRAAGPRWLGGAFEE